MSKSTTYVAKKPDADGFIHYDDTEHAIWAALVKQQMEILPERACSEFMDGLKALQLSEEQIPQLNDINKVLQATTGWRVAAVPALISFDRFFGLLANREFPVATFIRRPEHFEYLQEPDIFHEIFGHCPLLTNPDFAEFTHTYGKLGLAASKEDRIYLARLYWMTVEFGLVKTGKGLRIYGGGILSSPGESVYCLESDVPQRVPFDVLEALRTPYRIDIMQPVYFIIENMRMLHDISEMDLMSQVSEAKKLGLRPPLFSKDKEKRCG